MAILLVLCVFLVGGAALVSQAGTCKTSNDDADGVRTLAGSCKNNAGDLRCGETGEVANVGGVGLYANSGSERSEVEACNDTGAGNQQGRVVLRANHNTANPGARFSLDSDKDQAPSNICCSYVNVQVAPQSPGVWCGEDAPPGGSGVPGDGYARAWNNPGDDGMSGNEPGDLPGPAECAPAVG